MSAPNTDTGRVWTLTTWLEGDAEGFDYGYPTQESAERNGHLFTEDEKAWRWQVTDPDGLMAASWWRERGPGFREKEPMITMPQEAYQQLRYERDAYERLIDLLRAENEALRARLIVEAGGCSNPRCQWERGHSGPCNVRPPASCAACESGGPGG